MDSRNKQLSRLQQLLLKELRPSLLNQWDSQTCKDTPNLQVARLIIGPEYTTVYSGFFLDGILTVAIDPAHEFEFHFVIELMDSNCGGSVKITREKAESVLAESGGEGLVSEILPAIERFYTKLTVREAKNEIRH